MLAAGAGAIVNNASLAGVIGVGGLPAYTAAKHGVVGLTRSAALAHAGDGVRVNAIVTGNVDTPLYRRLLGVRRGRPAREPARTQPDRARGRARGDRGVRRPPAQRRGALRHRRGAGRRRRVDGGRLSAGRTSSAHPGGDEPQRPGERRRCSALPASEFALIVGVAAEMGAYGSDEHYELVLGALVDGLRAR